MCQQAKSPAELGWIGPITLVEPDVFPGQIIGAHERAGFAEAPGDVQIKSHFRIFSEIGLKYWIRACR